MPELITLGETMAAFSPGGVGALRYVSDYRMRIAGAESNLAIGVAKLGGTAGWISCLGADEFGAFVHNSVRAEGVDTACARMDETHRTGIMFKETGAGETKVYYYRENSAASHMCPDDLPPAYFAGAKIVHLTGITPVLSESCYQTVLRAFELAEERGAQVSFDPNVRKKLWREKDYAPILRELALRAQIVLLGLEEAEILFDTREPDEIFDQLLQLGSASHVAIKNGAQGAWVADHTTRRQVPAYSCRCIEPIGAGDAFNAGFLSGLLAGENVVRCGQMGCIAGALATQTPGDIEGYPSAAQMNAALDGTDVTYR